VINKNRNKSDKIKKKENKKMDIKKAISQEGLRWRCREHPKVPSDFICLDGDA